VRFRGLAARAAPIAAACTLLAACTFGNPPPDQSGAPPNLPTPSAPPSGSESPGDPGSTLDVVATKLTTPWGLTFLRDGSALVTERRTGRILKIGQPQTVNGLTVTPVRTITGLNTSGDGGLLGIAASPRFDTDHTAYIYYTTSKDNRIATVRLDSDSAPHVIVDGLPRASTRNGGALAFGPEGDLYASVGDANGKPGNVSHKELAGKILRMTTAGKPVKGAKTLVYASGFQDVEGFSWDQSGHMLAMDTTGTGTAVKDRLAGVSTKGASTLQTWDPDDSTCAGVAVIGNLLATGCLTGQRIWVVNLTPTGGTLGAPTDALRGTYGRLRGAGAAPDGSLWVMTSNTDGHGHPKPDDDQILRIVLSDSGVGMS
jgi:glucose/arabinose dehydrogenase